ncbi:MAG: hypothetical protein ACPGJS_05855 [Flammeovirgaceae bacterium]
MNLSERCIFQDKGWGRFSIGLLLVSLYFFELSIGHAQVLKQSAVVVDHKTFIDSLNEVQQFSTKQLKEGLSALDLKTKATNKVKDEAAQRIKLFHRIYQDELQLFKKPQKMAVFEWKGGNADYNYQFSERTGAFPSEVPAKHQQLSFTSNVDVMTIPLKANGLFSSPQLTYYQPNNQFAVAFDWAAFQERIRQRLAQKTKAIHQLITVEKYTAYKDLDVIDDFQQKAQLDAQSLKTQLKLNQALHAEAIPEFNAQFAQEFAAFIDKEQLNALPAKEQAALERKYQQKLEKYKKEKLQQADKKTQKQQQFFQQLLQQSSMTASKLDSLIEVKDSLETVDLTGLLAVESIQRLEKLKAGSKEDAALLEELGYLSKTERLLSSIEIVELGTAYPSYTPFTLHHVPVSGLNVALNPSLFYLAFTASTPLNFLQTGEREPQQFLAGRIGVGNKERNYVILSAIKSEGQLVSLLGNELMATNASLTLDFFDKPRSNAILGIEAGVSLTKRWRIRAEFNQASTSRDATLEKVGFGNVWKQLTAETLGEGLLQTGWAGNVETNLTIDPQTEIAAKYERVSPQYFSLGAPFLRTDYQGYELSIRKSYFDGKLSLQGTFGEWQDNLGKQRLATTFLSSYAAQAQINLMKQLSIDANYQLNLLKGGLNNTITTYNTSLTYGYQWGNTQVQTALLGTWSESKQAAAENQQHTNLVDPVVKQATFTQQFIFRNSLTMATAVSYLDEDDGNRIHSNREIKEGGFAILLHRRNGLIGGQWITTSATVGYDFFGIWKNTLEVTYGFGNNHSTRANIAWRSEYPIMKQFKLSVSGQYAQVNTGDVLKDYKDFTGLIHLSYTF